jgi:hypothetical protein
LKRSFITTIILLLTWFTTTIGVHTFAFAVSLNPICIDRIDWFVGFESSDLTNRINLLLSLDLNTNSSSGTYTLTPRSTAAGGSTDDKNENDISKAKDVLESFFQDLEFEDLSGARDLISQDYDGNIGGSNSKVDLVFELRDFLKNNNVIDISHTITNPTAIEGGILLDTNWRANINGTLSNGRTTWWIQGDKDLSGGMVYRIIHAEGDWFF